MINDRMALADFGWSPFFQSQLDIELLDQTFPVRIEAIHRAAIDVIAPCLDFRIEPTEGEWQKMPSPAVGDWLLVDRLRHRPLRLLERKSIIRRKAPGGAVGVQPIAANIDTLLIVSSCNQDFNPRRLERYLTLAHQAEIQPVIVLTKADLADDVGAYGDRARALAPGDLLVECLDGRAADDVAKLAPWCGPGRTVAVVGSSGVGKSTLVNTLRGEVVAATAGIREDDARGRHTTTGRALFRLPAGGWILDTPGMREIQLVEVETGIAAVFGDIVSLAAACRFRDCDHRSEPGCAVRGAVEAGHLDPGRLRSFRKLAAEEAHNTSTVAESRARARAFGRMTRTAAKQRRDRRGE